MLRRLITESNMLWQRTDKSGVGESQGTACARLDYETELAHHRAALRQLQGASRRRPATGRRFRREHGLELRAARRSGRRRRRRGRVGRRCRRRGSSACCGSSAMRWSSATRDPQALAAEVSARAAYFRAIPARRARRRPRSRRAIPKLGKVWRRIVGTSDDRSLRATVRVPSAGAATELGRRVGARACAGARAVRRVRLVRIARRGAADREHRQRRASRARRRFASCRSSIITSRAMRAGAMRSREKDGKEHADPAVEAILEWLSQIGVRKE